jgi:hypothetical protein
MEGDDDGDEAKDMTGDSTGYIELFTLPSVHSGA